MDTETKYMLKAYGANIASTNYYNDIHKIVRIEFNKRQFDFKLINSIEVPNPTKHIAIVITSDEFLNETHCISTERESYLPGYIDINGNLSNLPMGYVYLVNKKQTISTTNPGCGGAGFSISKTNMFDLDNVSIAISPSTDRDYTNIEKSDKDIKDSSIGFFINKDNTILIKSKGSSITMGEEGIYFGGSVSWESSEHQREWLMDNPFHRFIPATIVTIPISIPEIPNLNKFAQIANLALKVKDVIDVSSSVANLTKVI